MTCQGNPGCRPPAGPGTLVETASPAVPDRGAPVTIPTRPSTKQRDTELRTTCCPECGSIAEIEWSETVHGSSGAVEMVKIRCILRHWFLLPLAG